MMLERFNNWNIILASQSPRRQDLLKGLGLSFRVKPVDVDEAFPNDLAPEQVAAYLSKLKADHFPNTLQENELLITADTTVLLEDSILNKPIDRADSVRMLQLLSGKQHAVVSGVTIRSAAQSRTFSESTAVYFKELTASEIDHYIDHYQPYDKAGSYGIQEWIGYIGIERIEGCYFNVMGLPLFRLYQELSQF